jgi:hypothetical protein
VHRSSFREKTYFLWTIVILRVFLPIFSQLLMNLRVPHHLHLYVVPFSMLLYMNRCHAFIMVFNFFLIVLPHTNVQEIFILLHKEFGLKYL